MKWKDCDHSWDQRSPTKLSSSGPEPAPEGWYGPRSTAWSIIFPCPISVPMDDGSVVYHVGVCGGASCCFCYTHTASNSPCMSMCTDIAVD